jgi:hypothetical protein
MARIRTVKPEYWSSPDTAACDDPWARLLFIAMWNWADDNGRGTANPKELAGFAFPNDDKIEPADVRRMLGGIRRAFGVDFYRVDGRPYYSIASWDRHQKIDKRGQGKHPGPEQGEPWDPDPTSPPDLRRSGDRSVAPESSEEPAEPSPSPRWVPGAGTEEQGNRGTTPSAADASGERAPRHATATDMDAGFTEFYAAYPRKKEPQDALKAWRQTRRKGVPAARLVEAAKQYAQQCAGKETQFLKYPASWLRAGAYDSEPESTHVGQQQLRAQAQSLAELRDGADARGAARLLGIAYVPEPQPPRDQTPADQWDRQQALAFLDTHAAAIDNALRRAG